MKKLGYICLCVAVLILLLILSRVELIDGDSREYPLPEEGKWISHDGSIVLSFDREDPYSTIVVEGSTVQCVLSQEHHSPDVYLICEEYDHPDHSRGDTLFWGKITEIKDDCFSIVSYRQRETYIFTKLE